MPAEAHLIIRHINAHLAVRQINVHLVIQHTVRACDKKFPELGEGLAFLKGTAFFRG